MQLHVKQQKINKIQHTTEQNQNQSLINRTEQFHYKQCMP